MSVWWIKNNSRKSTIIENKKRKSQDQWWLKKCATDLNDRDHNWPRASAAVSETHCSSRAKMVRPGVGSPTMSEHRQDSDLFPGKMELLWCPLSLWLEDYDTALLSSTSNVPTQLLFLSLLLRIKPVLWSEDSLTFTWLPCYSLLQGISYYSFISNLFLASDSWKTQQPHRVKTVYGINGGILS